MISQSEPNWESVTKWAALEGEWEITGEKCQVKGIGDSSPPFAHGLAVCDVKLRDGLIRASVKFDSPNGSTEHLETHAGSAGIVLGFSPDPRAYLVAGLGAFNRAFSIWEFVPAAGWFERAKAGQIQNLRYGREYKLQIAQIGQRISLAVDGVPILDPLLPSPLAGGQLGLYSMAKCGVVFRDFEVAKKRPTAFVAMQFDEPGNTIYHEVIEPVAESAEFDVVRIDEVDRPGIIFQEIQKNIEDAKVIIAEITAPNQNVFYEVGYAHALNKPTILLAQRHRELPFDIRSYRVIFYDDSIAGKPLVERALRNHLRSILQDA